MSQKVTSPEMGEIELVAQPIKMSDSTSTIKTSAPERGEHTDEILTELGITADEIKDFRSRTVI
jgi:formyl-CoA transferase